MLLVFTIIFSVLGVILRLVPHLPNVAPIGALALFAGVYLPRRYGIVLPLLVMLIGDFFVGYYEIDVMITVYASFAATVMIGWLVSRQPTFVKIFGGALAAAVLFFLTTNFAVWASSSWYPHTAGGLLSAYVMGLPFFRYSLMGDLLFTAVLFSSYAVATNLKFRFYVKELYGYGHPRS